MVHDHVALTSVLCATGRGKRMVVCRRQERQPKEKVHSGCGDGHGTHSPAQQPRAARTSHPTAGPVPSRLADDRPRRTMLRPAEVDWAHEAATTMKAAASTAGIAGEPIRRSAVMRVRAQSYTLLDRPSGAADGRRPRILDRSAYGMHANAKMKASAPMEPTRAWPMCVHVTIRS